MIDEQVPDLVHGIVYGLLLSVAAGAVLWMLSLP